jgi:rare lipoprotein A (peptidoglycan hydrolase)
MVSGAGYALASFYSHGRQTSSGEKFNPGDLTAPHIAIRHASACH